MIFYIVCLFNYNQVWAMSLPVVVIVHNVQEPPSWATICWDNAFSEIYRTPFKVTDHVAWWRMAHMLQNKFKQQTDGGNLSIENLNYLRMCLFILVLKHCGDGRWLFIAGEKAFRNPTDSNEQPISWYLFCKDQLPNRSFTFWEWFYAIMKLTNEHLKGPWKDGLIHGFIGKKEAEYALKKCEPGTFMLRFSDSQLGWKSEITH